MRKSEKEKGAERIRQAGKEEAGECRIPFVKGREGIKKKLHNIALLNIVNNLTGNEINVYGKQEV